MASDTEIIKVLLQIENPQVFKQLEDIRKGFNVKITSTLDKGLQQVLGVDEKKIRIIADDSQAIKSLEKIKNTLVGFQKLGEIRLNLSGDIIKDLDKIDRKITELQAKALSAQLAQLGAIQNNNVKTLPANAGAPGGVLDQARALQNIQDRYEEEQAAYRARNVNPNRRVQYDRNGNPLVVVGTTQEANGPNMGQFSPIRGGTPDNRDLITIERARRRAAQDAQEAAFRSQQSSEMKRQEAIDAYRIATAPFSRLTDNPAYKKTPLAAAPPLDLRNKETVKDLLQELGLGALAGGRGIGGTAFSLLGGIAGSAVPGGALLGSAVGGALFEGAAKGLEQIAGALENVTEAGIEFQKTIVALTGVLQTNTDVVGADGSSLSPVDQVRANTVRASAIQRAARSELLPLGIGGEAEATLVQGLFSGFSQRGIVLDPEQTKTISGRLGASIVGLAPQLLQNPIQLRKDVEDIGANSPNAGRTTLGVALKNLAPDLFRSLATGDEVVRATERLEQFKVAIQNSDQASVQLLRLSGAIDKLRTTAGDSFLQGLAPAFKGLADAFNSEGLDKALETLGRAGGQGLGALLSLATSGIVAFSGALSGLVETLQKIFPNLKAAPTPPLGVATPKPEVSIAAGLKSLGIESIGDVTKSVTENEPRSRFQRLQEAEAKVIQAQNGALEDQFLPGIFTEELKSLKDAQDKEVGRIDSFTFSGKRRAAEATSGFLSQRREVAERGLGLATNRFNAAQEKGDIDEQYKQSALINSFNDELSTVIKEEAQVRRDLILTGLDENKALQDLRNSSEAVSDAQFAQAKSSKELNRSLAEAKSNVEAFGKKAALATASQEEQLLQAAVDVEDAGGISPITNPKERLREAKLASAAAKFNSLAQESGLVGTEADGGPGGGLGLSSLNSPFNQALQRQQEALNDAVSNTSHELDILGRALRNATEAFLDLGKRLGLQLEDSDSNSSDESTTSTSSSGVRLSGGVNADGRVTLSGNASEDMKYVPGFMFDGQPVEAKWATDDDSNWEQVRGGGWSMSSMQLPAYPAAFGIAEAPDFDSLFSKNDGTGPLSRSQTYQKIMDRKALERNGAIPNASGMTNPAGRGVYEAITGGLLDSSIVQNVRPASSTVWKGGVNFDTEKQPNQGLDGVINAIKEVGNKISDQVRQGVESSFGGR